MIYHMQMIKLGGTVQESGIKKKKLYYLKA